MKHTFKAAVAALVLAVGFAGSAAAGPREDAAREDAAAAYRKGDHATGLRLMRPLAEHGDVRAQVGLGLMYEFGYGDYGAATSWYRKAAEQGDADAQVNLGILYGMGQGVPQDYVSAHMWFSLAVTGGHKDAMKARDMAAAKMTPAQIAEAKKLAREWRPKSTPVPPLVSGSRLLRSSDQQLWQPARR
jgi:uncharacterized protein